MKKVFLTFWVVFQFISIGFSVQSIENPIDTKQRIFVLTDISNEPDDEESMVRFLVYANQYEIEGLVATTSTWLRNNTREDLIRRQIDAYGMVRNNLLIHEQGFPTKEQLYAVTATGQGTYGMKAVGEGKSTAGSKLLLQAADKQDERPLWVSVWGGPNTLAQALFDARRTRSAEDLKKLIKKLRVYAISDQDDAGIWLRNEFPELFYVVSPSNADWKEYWRATWTGISGDRHYKNGPQYKFNLVQNAWLEENIINNHGALGKLYPKFAYIMEGDTPAFMGLINNGLGWYVSPSYGGWGGRYVLYQSFGESHPIWTNNQDSRDSVYFDNEHYQISDQATIWRWREHFQHDFAARMDWCVADNYKKANHSPMAVLNSDKTKSVIEITAKPNDTVQLSAKGTTDPDGNTTKISWFIYQEAGSYLGACKLSSNSGETTSLKVPIAKENGSIHVILQIEDNGTPSLVSYRRAVINVVK